MARSGGYPCARIPIFGWSDRNFRCIIYSRFNEPRKRSKGPRGLFLIIRRTREGRVSRSPFPPPSLLFSCALLPPPPPPLLSPFSSRAFNAARFFILLRSCDFFVPRDLLLDRRYFISTGCWCSSSRLEFLSPSFRRGRRSEKIDTFDTNRTQEWCAKCFGNGVAKI